MLFLLPAQHAHAVFARIGAHESQNPQFFSHHKDRRQLQLFRGLALHDRMASYVWTHLLDLFLSLCADGARQVRVALQTSREVDQDPERGLTRQRNA